MNNRNLSPNMKPKPKMWMLVVVCLGLAFYFADIANVIFKGNSIETLLTKAAEKINATAPLMLDSDTRLDTSIALGKTLIYQYTLVNYSAEEIDGDALSTAVFPMIYGAICDKNEYLRLLEKGAVLKFKYYGNQGHFIAHINIDYHACTSAAP